MLALLHRRRIIQPMQPVFAGSQCSQAVAGDSALPASPDNIYWERDIVDSEDLYARLQSAEAILQQPQALPLRLLIIDSIAHLFRDVGDAGDGKAYVQRTSLLFRLSALLRRYADMYQLAVVVTNQVRSACQCMCLV